MKFISIGGDPEFFMVDKDNNPVPSVGLLGGTKEAPRDLGGGYAIQEDNVMGEINLPIISSKKEWMQAFEQTNMFIDDLTREAGAAPVYDAHMVFPDAALQTEQAKMFGCSPDKNAWTMRMNKVFDAVEFGGSRFAGGHIHVAYEPDPKYGKALSDILLVRAMDVYLGVPSVVLDTDSRRKRFYGQAGNFREKPYGIEYRVLSNFWLRDEKYWNWVYRQVQFACLTATRFKSRFLDRGVKANIIQNVIRNNNLVGAQSIINKLGISLPR